MPADLDRDPSGNGAKGGGGLGRGLQGPGDRNLQGLKNTVPQAMAAFAQAAAAAKNTGECIHLNIQILTKDFLLLLFPVLSYLFLYYSSIVWSFFSWLLTI